MKTKYLLIRRAMRSQELRPSPSGRQILGKPTNRYFVLSLSSAELSTEIELIKQKKSNYSRNIRDMIVVRYMYLKRQEQNISQEEE